MADSDRTRVSKELEAITRLPVPASQRGVEVYRRTRQPSPGLTPSAAGRLAWVMLIVIVVWSAALIIAMVT